MADSKPASVTLLDLANDLDWFISALRNNQDASLRVQGIAGIQSITEILRGYHKAGFSIGRGQEQDDA